MSWPQFLSESNSALASEKGLVFIGIFPPSPPSFLVTLFKFLYSELFRKIEEWLMKTLNDTLKM